MQRFQRPDPKVKKNKKLSTRMVTNHLLSNMLLNDKPYVLLLPLFCHIKPKVLKNQQGFFFFFYDKMANNHSDHCPSGNNPPQQISNLTQLLDL